MKRPVSVTSSPPAVAQPLQVQTEPERGTSQPLRPLGPLQQQATVWGVNTRVGVAQRDLIAAKQQARRMPGRRGSIRPTRSLSVAADSSIHERQALRPNRWSVRQSPAAGESNRLSARS